MSTINSDVVFIGKKGGVPALVQGKDNEKASVSLKTDEAEIKKFHRHGFINGLSPKDKVTFNEIMDDVKESKEDAASKITNLKEKIETLNKKKETQQLAKYLQAQLFHLIQKHKVFPKNITVKERDLRL